MRYMLLICSDDKTAPPPPQAEMAAIFQGHMRFAEELHKAGKMVVGERLRPDAEASRVRAKAGHRQVMDGPFTETKEALGGFYLIECDTRQEAVEWAKKIPLVRGWLRGGAADLADVRLPPPPLIGGAGGRQRIAAAFGRARPWPGRSVDRQYHLARGVDRPRADAGRRRRTRAWRRRSASSTGAWSPPCSGSCATSTRGGDRPGGLRPGARSLAGERNAGPAGRLAPHDGAPARARPPAPRAPGRRARPALAYEAALGAIDESPDVMDPEAIPDDRLRLIFICCHPGLPADSRVALTLRLVGGSRRRRSRGPFSCPSRPSRSGSCAPSERSAIASSPTRCRGGRAFRAAAGRARGGLPDLQRGLRRARRRRARAPRPLRGGPPPGTHARRVDAGRARGPGPPRADGVAGLTGGGAHGRRWQPRPARGPGSLALGSGADRRGLALLDGAGSLERAGPYQLQAAIAACHARAPPGRRPTGGGS